MIKKLSFITIVVLITTFGFATQTNAETKITFVTPEWVAEHYNDSGLRILDVRQNPLEYFAGHVPNAVHLADNTLRGPLAGIPVQYYDLQMMSQLLTRAGVNSKDSILLYSEGVNVLGATMVAYILERLGHNQVMIMDGGWTAYKASQKITQEYPRYIQGKLSIHDNLSVRATLADIKKAVEQKGVVIIDARPAEVYRGETKTWMRNGHIPGAINIDWRLLTNADNYHRLKSLDEIKKLYEERGIKKDNEIILYCGTSREASLEYVVMKHLLGFSKVRLYEGSWTEYSSYPELKIETGAEPSK